MQLRKPAALAAVVLAAGLSLTACNGNGSVSASGSAGSAGASASAGGTASAGQSGNGGAQAGSGSGSAGSSGSGTSGSGTSGSGTSGSGSTGSASGTSASSKCLTPNLAIAVKSSGPASNGPYYDTEISMTNRGSGSCVMRGYPGVDFLTNYGSMSEPRTANQIEPTVHLAPGQATSFTILTPVNNTGGSGVRITGAKITPPNETHYATVSLGLNIPASDANSDGTAGVSPVGD
ncbi:DUF4232 domain-containing protein [Phaeacidiphilus oryzae]|jgi:hypothetical protein|uniref:DUF4232 domain-containing protein n=1 Tax=Phaeacidiphilus oryzae TaxID=348818 RepID=UPI00055B7241|nr:DUF4232 domain-containing protein [Phaeacidiphilus oryzae]